MKSLSNRPGPAPSATAARDGSTKWRTGRLRRIARERRWVAHAGLVLNDHGPLQGARVICGGVRLHASVVASPHVGDEFGCRDGGAGIAGQGTQERPHALWIPADAIRHANVHANVHAGHIVHLAAIRPQSARKRPAHAFGPSSLADELGDLTDGNRVISGLGRIPRKQARQRYRARRPSGFVQRHGTQAESDDATQSRVPSGVVRGNGRPGEDELAARAPVIDGPFPMVPDPRLQLPLVDEARRRSLQHFRRIGLRKVSSVLVAQPETAGKGRMRRQTHNGFGGIFTTLALAETWYPARQGIPRDLDAARRLAWFGTSLEEGSRVSASTLGPVSPLEGPG